MRFNIYCNNKERTLIKEDVSQEDVIKYLKALTILERSHIYLEPIPIKEKDEKER